MTTYANWRTGPPPRACNACDAALTACESVRMLRGRPCCTDCFHGDDEAVTTHD